MEFDLILILIILASPIAITILVALTMEKMNSYYNGKQKKSNLGISKPSFGPRSDRIWQRLSEKLNGKYIA